MESNPTRVCELIVGLGDVDVLGVVDEAGGPLAVHVETGRRPVCGGCGGAVWSKGASAVRLVDLAAFGRPARLIWHKRHWCCPAKDCPVGSFTEVDEQIAPARAALTSRAGRWATVQVGRFGRPSSMWPASWAASRRTVNGAMTAQGQALLDADAERVGAVSALGLDETLYKREGRWRTRRWCTSIVDVTGGQLLDVVPGRDAAAPAEWLEEQPEEWRDGITWGVLDLSGTYRSAFDDALPRAGQVADPFHVVRLANDAVDETRRRTQNDTLGHRGRKDDPLCRIRRLLVAAHERLDGRGDAEFRGLLAAGDPRGEVRLAQHAKETLRGLYDIDRPQVAGDYLTELADDLADTDQPELRRLGRTLGRWHAQITNWHRARVSNGPAAAIIIWSVSEGVGASRTTGSGRCSTLANPAGRSPPASLPAEIRRAANSRSVGNPFATISVRSGTPTRTSQIRAT